MTDDVEMGSLPSAVTVPRETPEIAAVLFGDRTSLAQAYAAALGTSGVERGLLGPREVPRIWDRHLFNSVVLSELIAPGASLADVGSGAGLPGIPLAIARPDLSVSLVEPLLRRVVWLREVVQQVELTNVEIVRARADAVADSGETYDVVTARAVAPLTDLLQLCMPLLRPGGELLAMKGESAAHELEGAEPALRKLGAARWSVVTCGAGVLAVPTTVVRVVAGDRPAGRRAQGSGARAKRAPGRAARGGGSTAKPSRRSGGHGSAGDRRPRPSA